MKTCNFTGRGQLRFGNLNDQIWEDCKVSGEQQLFRYMYTVT